MRKLLEFLAFVIVNMGATILIFNEGLKNSKMTIKLSVRKQCNFGENKLLLYQRGYVQKDSI